MAFIKRINLLNGEKILNEIQTLLREFNSKFKGVPLGIVMGPREYLSLNEHLKKEYVFDKLVKSSLAEAFFQLPVYTSKKPGIDLLIDKDDMIQLAQHTVGEIEITDDNK